MGILNPDLIQRKPGTREIDVQVSMHAFAKELIALKDEERRVRGNRRYRHAIRSALKSNENGLLSRGELVRSALTKMRLKNTEKDSILSELWEHISLNIHGGYLRMIPGKGVELVKP